MRWKITAVVVDTLDQGPLYTYSELMDKLRDVLQDKLYLEVPELVITIDREEVKVG